MNNSITNKEAIKLIDDRMCFGRGKWTEHHQPIIDNVWEAGIIAINALEKTQWIPCSERLPKEEKEVLVTVWNRCEIASYNCALDGLQEWRFDDFSLDNEDFLDVTAWMPLPEPYEESK